MAVTAARARVPLAALALVVYLFLYAPILVLAALSFNASRLSATWDGFTLAWYVKAATNPAILSALRNSLLVGFAATAIATTCGTAAALAMHRHRFRQAGLLHAAVLLPTVAPEIVLAASLLLLFASAGMRLGCARRRSAESKPPVLRAVRARVTRPAGAPCAHVEQA